MSPDGFSGSSIQHGTHHFIKSLIGVTFQCALSIFINQATPKTWNETPSRSESIVIRDYGKTWIYGISKTPHVSKNEKPNLELLLINQELAQTQTIQRKVHSPLPTMYANTDFHSHSPACDPLDHAEEGDTRPWNTRVSRVLEISLGILFFYRHSEWGPEN